MRIFVLEDNDERLRWFMDNFQDQRLVVTNDSRLAVMMLKAVTFDVAFLDHDLGQRAFTPSDEMSGWAVAAELADDERHEKTEVIVHSHNTQAANRMFFRLMDAGRKARLMPFGMFDRNVIYN